MEEGMIKPGKRIPRLFDKFHNKFLQASFLTIKRHLAFLEIGLFSFNGYYCTRIIVFGFWASESKYTIRFQCTYKEKILHNMTKTEEISMVVLVKFDLRKHSTGNIYGSKNSLKNKN